MHNMVGRQKWLTWDSQCVTNSVTQPGLDYLDNLDAHCIKLKIVMWGHIALMSIYQHFPHITCTIPLIPDILTLSTTVIGATHFQLKWYFAGSLTRNGTLFNPCKFSSTIIIGFEQCCYISKVFVCYHVAQNVCNTPNLNFIKKQKLSSFGHIKRHQTLVKLILEWKVKLKGQGKRGRPKRYWEKDVEDWMGASVWDEQQKISWCIGDPSRQQRPETDKQKRERHTQPTPLL